MSTYTINANGSITIRDAQIFSRNFAGEEKPYNDRGKRNFCLVIDDPQLAEKLTNEGWNIKHFKQRDPDDEPAAFTQIGVNMGSKNPPLIRLNTSKGPIDLSESNLGLLDRADLQTIDLTINPYHWKDRAGNPGGVKGYLHTLIAKTYEDELRDSAYTDEDALPFN